ncbi:MAG: hypothetical protein GY765_28670 [bacterium]|nr:hypothetical protein [bacterium]
MNKIRIIFLVCAFLLMLAGLLMFNMVSSPPGPQLKKMSEFNITEIAGNGNTYVGSKPITRNQPAEAQIVDIKRSYYADDIYLMTDSQTTCHFFCLETAFTVLPGSYLHYHSKTKKFRFFEGTYYWQKESTGKKVVISIHSTNSTRRTVSKKLTLSDSGKLQATASWGKIWNYAGNLEFLFDDETTKLGPGSFLNYGNRVKTAPLLRAPKEIKPIVKDILLDKPGDSVVDFSWQKVKGAEQYIFRLYPSTLMENVLFEKEIAVHRFALDLLQFDQYREFYWQVIPFDVAAEREGVPSKMGNIKMTGALLNKDAVLKPPTLTIKTLDTNGNLVLIQGQTEINTTLFVNDAKVTLNMDGTFMHTINFNEIGQNRIVFKAVSASGIETIVERYVTTYDE